MRINNTLLIEDGDLSNTTITSEAYPVEHVKMFAIQGVITGASSLNGSITVEASCDHYENKPANVSNFTTLSSYTTGITDNGSFMLEKENTGFSWVRVVYTRTAGSGTLNVRINSKGF